MATPPSCHMPPDEHDLDIAEQALVSSAQSMGIALSHDHLRQFRSYFHELTQWNERINLTSLVSPEDVYHKHFLDSLTVMKALHADETSSKSATFTLLDVGSGAGFPGIPLAIVDAPLQVTLLEATRKKAQFLEHLIRVLGVANASVVTGRAEEVAHVSMHREQYDWVVGRAVARMATLAEYMLPFCRVGGAMIAMKQGTISEELDLAERAIRTLGGELSAVLPVDNDLLAGERCLIVLRKAAATPDIYPRRPGMPAKRPL